MLRSWSRNSGIRFWLQDPSELLMNRFLFQAWCTVGIPDPLPPRYSAAFARGTNCLESMMRYPAPGSCGNLVIPLIEFWPSFSSLVYRWVPGSSPSAVLRGLCERHKLSGRYDAIPGSRILRKLGYTVDRVLALFFKSGVPLGSRILSLRGTPRPLREAQIVWKV
jgi:hypothetical protein